MATEGTPVQSPDRELVLGFQNGDERAYDEIFKRYHGRVWSICRRMLPTPHDAEEATQETFLKAYQALGRFNGSYYLGAWLGRIATNVCVDHLRSKSKSNLVALPEDQDDLVTEQGPEEIVINDHPRLHQAIQEIQPLHASALALRTLEGLSHQEIAGHLRMSPTQVKALLHRARCSLRRAWDKAEGWVLAPVFAVRYLLTDRATGEAGRLATVSPSAAPFIMERMAAASAIIVAAALTGLPTTEAPAPTRAPAAKVAEASPFRSQELKEMNLLSSSATASSSTGQSSSAASEAASQKSLVEDLVAEVDKVLHDRKKPEPPQHRTDDDEDGPIGPTASEGEKSVQKVKKAVNELAETLAP